MRRIALCFFGQARFLNNLECYNSHLTNILLPYQTDVFLHAWWTTGLTEYKPSKWSRLSSVPMDKYTIKKLRQFYNPLHAIYEPPRSFDDNEDMSNVKSHLYSIKRVGEAFRDYTSPNDYDFIVLSRFDNIIVSFPNLRDLENGFYKMAGHPGVADQLFVFSPEYVNFMNVYDNFDVIIQEGGYEGLEKIKKDHFFRTFPGKDMSEASFDIKLARS